MVATQTKISLSLDAADTTIMHCVGMTGLYMTLKRLEKQYPSSRQRGGHISWSLTADTIELFWQGSDFVALSWLIKESFQLDDTGLIHLTGLDNDGIDLRQKIHIHEGICAVFLRLNKFYQAGKIINTEPEMLNPNTKLYIFNYSNSKKPKIVNMTSSPQTNE
ncbi:MAG: type I-MYXAN CRISPR-associated Cas8a1/Cmx1, partial [Nostoc sp. NMS7]|uniref:type I-MYXAN CRISPR-associated Cas8a1/Cmx1 n=2 Tax=Nostoc TaxID=1177 RepID=UPI0025FD73E3